MVYIPNQDKVVGFTKKQREWFLERDNHRCMHRTFKNGFWVRCPSKAKLQVHHILPRGWCSLHMPYEFPVNGSLNGITLCDFHHVGKDSVHPDTFEALMLYREGNKQAFHEMMQERERLNKLGVPYWNTQYDWMFNRLVKKATAKFSKKKPYPTNGNRGNTGRIKKTRRR